MKKVTLNKTFTCTHLKNQFRIKKSRDPISVREGSSKNHVDTLFNDPNLLKNNAHADFNDKNLDNTRYVKVNSLPAINRELTQSNMSMMI